MAAKKTPCLRVAVCGLTSSSCPGLTGQGAGKSYLCNRFVRPRRDELHGEHTSMLNHSDFGSNVVNNQHCLYWGHKDVALEDGQDVSFQILEHTEFVDDSSLKPFPSTKPYHKRCTQLKILSGGKVAYVQPDQLALPEQYTDVDKFPDKFVVDGFIVCVDVSCDLGSSNSMQTEFFQKLLPNILSTKKPIVIAATKFDIAAESSVGVVHDVVSHCKKACPVVEVSALRGINVDLCFLVLAHLIDSKKPKARLVPYADARQHMDERIRRSEGDFQKLLDRSLSTFTLSVYQAMALMEKEPELSILRDISGSERVRRLVRGKLNYLRQDRVSALRESFTQQLPSILATLLPSMPIDASPDYARAELERHERCKDTFSRVEDWHEDIEFLAQDSPLVPFQFLSEPAGEELVRQHIDKVVAAARTEVACRKIQEALGNATSLVPGKDMSVVFEEVGVAHDATFVPTKRLVRLYHDKMATVEQESVTALQELFLERSELFVQGDSAESLEIATRGLQSCERYTRLNLRSDLRKSAIIKHIANLQWPDKGPYAKSPQLAALKDTAPRTVSPPPLRPRSTGRQWALHSEGDTFQMALLARSQGNAMTLRSDFMNHLSGSDTCEVRGRTYKLRIELFQGQALTSLTSADFVPQGAVAVVNSSDCMDWLAGLLESLWLPSGVDGPLGKTPPYRGMPLVIVAIDKAAPAGEGDSPPLSSSVRARSRVLADSVQAILIEARPPTLPKRLVMTPVVRSMLTGLVDSLEHFRGFMEHDLQLQEDGVNVAVCSLVGDPYTPSQVLSPWLRHQLVCLNEGSGALFLGSVADKQHHVCTLTFHSALNLSDVLSCVRLGFILLYSAARVASLGVIRSLVPKLPKIPILIVAVVTDGCLSNQLVEEGLELADQCGAMFLTTHEWRVGSTSKFLSKCWFSRLSSWGVQTMSDEVKRKISQRKPRPLPNRPLPQPGSSSPPTRSLSPPPAPVRPGRHSIAFLDMDEVSPLSPPPPAHLQSTLPHSPARTSYIGMQEREEEPTYSNPQQAGLLDRRQKMASLDRQKRTSLQRSSLASLETAALLSPEEENEEYALVADHVHKHLLATSLPRDPAHGPTPLPRATKSPSFSPPPPPQDSPTTETPPLRPNGVAVTMVDGVGQGDVYASVQKPRPKPKPRHNRSGSGSFKKYNRLTPTARPPGGGYDHLFPRQDPETDSSPPRGRLDRGASLDQVDDHIYSAVVKPKPRHRRHASADLLLSKPATPPGTPPEQLYSTVAKPLRHAHPGQAPEDLYALPEPRVRRQPGTAPKPRKSERLSPTPGKSPKVMRSKTMDTSSPSLSQRLKGFLTSPTTRRKKQPSPKPKPASPLPPLGQVSVRAASLPKNFRDRTHSVEDWEEGEGWGPEGDSGDEIPLLPKRSYTPDDLGLEEAPPLPPRRYSWSDMEDNDDEVLQSDDDLDESPMSLPLMISLSDHQTMYASLNKYSEDHEAMGGIEAIYNVVNRAVEKQVSMETVHYATPRPQPQRTEPEEQSVYDTLESVMKSMPRSMYATLPGSLAPKESEATPLLASTPDEVSSGQFGASPTGTGTSPLPVLPTSPMSTPSHITFTSRQIKVMKQQQKLLAKLQKKTQKEAERRRRTEEKRRWREEGGSKKKGKKGKGPKERARYFGSPLADVVGQDGIPVFIKSCVAFVEAKGLNFVGIYRVSGKKEDVLGLQDRVDEDSSVDVTTLGYCESAVSSTLKAFFKLLPEPLISDAIAAKLISVNALEGVEGQQQRCRTVLTSMRRPNLRTLHYLVQHLYNVQLHNVRNKMSASNLAIVFWPTLMRPPLQDLADPSKQLGWQLAMTLLIQHPDFVPSPSEDIL